MLCKKRFTQAVDAKQHTADSLYDSVRSPACLAMAEEIMDARAKVHTQLEQGGKSCADYQAAQARCKTVQDFWLTVAQECQCALQDRNQVLEADENRCVEAIAA